jgi:hypothetical protein
MADVRAESSFYECSPAVETLEIYHCIGTRILASIVGDAWHGVGLSAVKAPCPVLPALPPPRAPPTEAEWLDLSGGGVCSPNPLTCCER